MKVVLDTNVVVSALLNRRGAESAVLFAVADHKLIWCVSRPVLAEYETVLRRPKFHKIPEAYITALLELTGQAQMFASPLRLRISPDPSDNRFYECASAAQTDFLVTGNTKHFPKDLPPTRVVKARQLLDALV